MSIIKLNSENFENEVLNYEGKVLIDFYADWCGPCRMLAPIIEDIAEERSDVKVCKINVDDENALAMSFQISSIPTVVIIEGGKIKERFSGVKPMEDILALL
jgi:thioredoxin 1